MAGATLGDGDVGVVVGGVAAVTGGGVAAVGDAAEVGGVVVGKVAGAAGVVVGGGVAAGRVEGAAAGVCALVRTSRKLRQLRTKAKTIEAIFVRVDDSKKDWRLYIGF